MTESKVFTDNFSRSFTESGDFFQFLSDRKARSKWMTAPSRELQFEPVERGSTLGNLYMQIYDHNGAAEILEDTMENTSLLLKVDGKDYPVRSCALKTVLERARISGHALNKVSKSVFAEILNYCMGVASGDSLIKVADEKVSAVHGGDPKDYTVMEMLPLFKATNDFLDREYPGNRFMTAHFDHSIATAIWCLDGQADKLLDTYHREIAVKGLQTEKMVPALRFSTSDVGMSGANLYPIFLVGAESRIVPLGYSIRTEHKNGVDMQYFEEQLRLVYAQFEKALDKQVQLMNMPNWAFGYVNVTGTRDGIKSFIERFVSEDDPSTIPGKRFFARSFIQSKRQAFIDEAMKEFSEPAVDAKASYSFVASFAWSAYSCLIGGYPQNSPSECLTLSEACAEDGVSVMIQTSEPGICFEEHITCDDTGTVEHTEKDLLAYKCRHCGEITSFASFEDPDDQECPECGNCGFDRCEEV